MRPSRARRAGAAALAACASAGLLAWHAGGARCVAAPWLVGSWNQHRKSSYLQKDCDWITRLQNEGYSKNKASSGVNSLSVSYSPLEMQQWADGHDIVAVQEADPEILRSLGRFSRHIIKGMPDVDARGVTVASNAVLLLHPDRGIKVLEEANAVVKAGIPGPGRPGGKRDLVAVLVERESDGQRAVFCSVHIHPPRQVEEKGVGYLAYLAPLRDALEKVSAAAGGDVPYFLVGDFNTNPEDWEQRTASDPFWKKFRCCRPNGNAQTATHSNPDPWGDFAIFTKGAWQAQALGSEGMDAFHRHVDHVVEAAGARIAQRGPPEEQAQFRRWYRPLRRGLLNSDHRPLQFAGSLAAARAE